MEAKFNELALHFKYWAFIALLFFVFLMTERWSASKEFTTYLSNAATMTSLLLAVVAIFYSFISNDGMSRSLGSISTVASEVREVREDIEAFAGQTKLSTETAAINNSLVRSASAELSSTMTSLSETLSAISNQNAALKDLVASLPTRIDQLETRFGDVANAISEKQQQSQVPITSADLPATAVERFLGRVTFQQHLIVVACVLAADTGKELDMSALCKVIDWNAPNQFQGFLSCMHAVQLCSRSFVQGKDKTYTIKSIHPDLQSSAKQTFVRYVESNFGEKPDERAKWLGRLAGVEALFA
ncbi:hypothetical protein [Rubrivivax albus]|uniref:Uncharacterized protein n=1 Tax=Rubrivivax albus TaxID=2499835 RepID=A0A437JJR3_9BURK|nr:hypothetical protein [Rubrivivax albus]RVT46847.1 hypothetical protein ENE75_24505 [Rubrivivax albus]